jgi:hypothetical protein
VEWLKEEAGSSTPSTAKKIKKKKTPGRKGGRKEGRMKEGMKEGKREGRKEGKREGMKEGRKEGRKRKSEGGRGVRVREGKCGSGNRSETWSHKPRGAAAPQSLQQLESVKLWPVPGTSAGHTQADHSRPLTSTTVL